MMAKTWFSQDFQMLSILLVVLYNFLDKESIKFRIAIERYVYTFLQLSEQTSALDISAAEQALLVDAGQQEQTQGNILTRLSGLSNIATCSL